MEREIWKDVEGYEGLYQVSNFGRLKRLNYKNSGKDKILKAKNHPQGYLFNPLWKNGKRKNYFIHRLVAMAFLDNPNDYPEVNHKDENQANNKVENLEWCTSSYNTKYSRKKHPERYLTSYKGKRTSHVSKYSCYEVNQLSLDGEIIKTWNNIAEIVRETKYNNASITRCCFGKRKTAYGYKWEFADKNASSLFI